MSELIQLADKTAGHHRERWVGTVNPHGLRSPTIPLSAYVVAASDAFEVSTTARTYDAALPLRCAQGAIATERARHLDPGCVHAFLAVHVP